MLYRRDIKNSSTCSTRSGFGRAHKSATARRILIAACALTVAVSGCADPAARIRGLTAGSILLAFGDSLTSGEGAVAQDTYPSVLAHITGYKVVNAGIPGELSAAGLKRLPSALNATPFTWSA